jgi:hypothetical protein
VQSWAERLTHVVQADTTNEDTLRRLGCTSSTARWWALVPTSRPAF